LDTPSATALEALLGELRVEGRAIIIATHDFQQARRCELVLCLNRAQVGFGPPAEVLDRETLEAAYGGAIVEIPGEVDKVILPPHHHH
jgi:ABC-type Mn2+/Zn2+ transport system ATPase subunit